MKNKLAKLIYYPNNFKIRPNYSQSYKQIGNSVSIPVIKALANEIILHI